MIRIPQAAAAPKLDKDSTLHSLDQLVESLCEAYSIPASTADKLRSGLETNLYEYLTSFLADFSAAQLNENSAEIEMTSLPADSAEAIASLVESIRVNSSVTLKLLGSSLIKISNLAEGIEYELLDINPSSIPADTLIESWRCEDPSKLQPLLSEIISISRKES